MGGRSSTRPHILSTADAFVKLAATIAADHVQLVPQSHKVKLCIFLKEIC